MANNVREFVINSLNYFYNGLKPTLQNIHTTLAAKQDVINDLDQIRIGATAGTTAYKKPQDGIPASDLAEGIIPDVSAFITKSVNDLTNYYTKTQTYTQTEVNNLIGAINQFKYEIVASTSAVTSPKSNVLYLIGPIGSGSDKYEEYIYPNSTTGLVKIGDTSIDLSGYVTIQSLNTALADYQAKLVSGTNIKTVNNSSLLGSGNVSVGTITGITMNGTSKGTSGVVNLGTVITSHQDISGKVDKVSGKGLSTNDYTTTEKEKLEGIASNAQVNILEGVKVNGTAQTITNKTVDISVPDVPSIAGNAGKVLAVNSGSTGMEWINGGEPTAITNEEIDAEWNKNYLKLSGAPLSTSGTIIEVGRDYDTSDLSSNPPTLFDANGNTIEHGTFIIDRNVLICYTTGVNAGRLMVPTDSTPTTYTFALAPSRGNTNYVKLSVTLPNVWTAGYVTEIGTGWDCSSIAELESAPYILDSNGDVIEIYKFKSIREPMGNNLGCFMIGMSGPRAVSTMETPSIWTTA